MSSRIPRIGIGGPVGCGKSMLIEKVVPLLAQKNYRVCIISNDVIYDENFRSNEVVIDFELTGLMLEEGEGLQIRLETDQLRDWHKPYTEWIMSAPSY